MAIGLEGRELRLPDRSLPQLIAGKTTALNGALLIEGRAPILFCSGGERDRVDRTMPWSKRRTPF